MNERKVILKACGITKEFVHGKRRLEILRGLDLTLYKGDALCILGPSGAGKSTFLHILGGLDAPTVGHVEFYGENLSHKASDELALFRNRKVGFVFQSHYLLSEFTALENVMIPARIGGVSAAKARVRAERLLSYLGLNHRKTHYPSELSGGEQQRVAVARALIMEPELLLADEPTGNLDSENTQKIQDLFFQLQKEMDLTLLVVTHDEGFARRFPRRKVMQDGRWVNKL
ncbi:MAG: ABC transporter ATP-binding protein [Bdellovibrio sp.]|nr:MAG: ABC transporter ATP-binding protein [Bdellovibrio sp.]